MRKFLFIISILALSLLFNPQFATPQTAEAGSFVVTPTNTQGWGLGDFGTPPTYGFVDTTGASGSGSIHVEITVANSKFIMGRGDYTGIPLSNFNNISYSTRLDAASTNNRQFYVNMYVTPTAAVDPAYVYRLDFAPTGSGTAWQNWSAGPNDAVWNVYNRDIGGYVAGGLYSINSFMTACAAGGGDWTQTCTAPTINNPWGGTGGSILFNMGDTSTTYVGFNGNLDNISIDITGGPGNPNTWDFETTAPVIVNPGGGGTGGTPCLELDDRENPLCEYPYQTATVYCRFDSVHIYDIDEDTSLGSLVINETMEDLEALGVPQGEPRLLAQSPDGHVRLYRLPGGLFQVNSPITDELRGYMFNGYVFRFAGCP